MQRHRSTCLGVRRWSSVQLLGASVSNTICEDNSYKLMERLTTDVNRSLVRSIRALKSYVCDGTEEEEAQDVSERLIDRGIYIPIDNI